MLGVVSQRLLQGYLQRRRTEQRANHRNIDSNLKFPADDVLVRYGRGTNTRLISYVRSVRARSAMRERHATRVNRVGTNGAVSVLGLLIYQPIPRLQE